MHRCLFPVPVTLLAFLLADVPASGAQWIEQQEVGRFVIRADFPLGDHQELMDELGDLERDLTACLGLGPAKESVSLFLFRNRQAYQGYMHEYFPGVPDRRALYIKGKGPGWVFAFASPEFGVDVRHESTHALLHAQLPTVPLWLDEGLAEYFEVPAPQRAFSNPHLSATRWAARFYRVRPLEELEQLRDLQSMGKSEYRSAWAWVHFMLHGPPAAHQTLVRYMRDIHGKVPTASLSDRLRQAIPDPEKAFLDHFRRWSR